MEGVELWPSYEILLLPPNLHNSVVTPTRAMSQTPRTPLARDSASLDPAQDAGDADGVSEHPYYDENSEPARESAPPTTGKRGRSPNWLPCELVAAFLSRQHAVREKGSQSKLVERQNAATRVYSSIIHALDDEGLCAWSDGKDGRRLPGSARESVTQRTAPNNDSRIYSKGDSVKASLKLYAQKFGSLYPGNSKNGYSPGTGDNDGKITWGATERACVGELSLPVSLDTLRSAHRIVCASSPYLSTDQALLSYIDATFALDPAQRLDQDEVPSEKDMKEHQKRRMKEAGNDMAFGQIQNNAAIERDEKLQEELSTFFRTCQAAMTKLQEEGMGHDEQHFAQQTKELDEREQRLQKYEEDINARLSQVESMQLQLNAMLKTFQANNSAESPADVARQTTVGTSAKVTTEEPVIPEDETIRKSSRPHKRKTFED